MMSYFWRVATTIWHWICWSAATLFRAIALVVGILVLAVFIAPDFLPKRRSKQLTSPTPNPRRLPRPIREGSDIFVLNPDGTKVALEPLEAKLQAEAWFQVVAGGFVFEKTRVKLDADG